jgi:hypothetical protein
MGGGWVGEEALAISLYCALAAEGNFAKGVRLAVNHTGDSDSTGSITGNILGAMQGKATIPALWLRELELKDVSPSPLSRQKTWSLKVHSMPARLKVKFFFRMMSSSGTGVIHSHLGAALPRSMAERWLWVTPPLPFVKIPLPLLVHGSRPAL